MKRLLLLVIFPVVAFAQDYPTRPVRMLRQARIAPNMTIAQKPATSAIITPQCGPPSPIPAR